MEVLLNFIIEHADKAHYVAFFMLVLAGLSIPISEDLVIIAVGVLASSQVPENVWKIYIAIFFGAFIADLIVYTVGRKVGPRLEKLKWFSKMITKERLKWVSRYYEKYGILTLIVGRFIPFGFRYGLFFTAGMGKMKFYKFLIINSFACFVSTAALYAIAFYFGKSEWLFSHLVTKINVVIFLVFAFATFGFVWYKRNRMQTEKEIE